MIEYRGEYSDPLVSRKIWQKQRIKLLTSKPCEKIKEKSKSLLFFRRSFITIEFQSNCNLFSSSSYFPVLFSIEKQESSCKEFPQTCFFHIESSVPWPGNNRFWRRKITAKTSLFSVRISILLLSSSSSLFSCAN